MFFFVQTFERDYKSMKKFFKLHHFLISIVQKFPFYFPFNKETDWHADHLYIIFIGC